MDDDNRIHVEGTVVRVLDQGCRKSGRPWRALVQDKTIDNIIHVTLLRASDLEEGDALAFDGRLVCGYSETHVGQLSLDLPRQVTMDDEDAQSRLSLLQNARMLDISTSDGGPPFSVGILGNHGAMQVVHRPRRGMDHAVNWVVGRFSERETAEKRGPVIVLDPALCLFGQGKAALPFMTSGATRYLEDSARTGKAGVNMLLDSPHHPRPRWWGVVVPPSLMQDPLAEWRGFVGKWSGLLPKAIPDFDTSIRLSLAHEMSHVVQHAYGVPRASGGSSAAECFADSAAIILLLLDGGSAEEARLYAHQRGAGALMFPGMYSTGAACHAAIAEARTLMRRNGKTTTHDALLAAARIAKQHAPPCSEELEAAIVRLPPGDTWSRLEWSGFDDWMASLSEHARHTFRVAVNGVHACAQPRGQGAEAGYVLASAWDGVSERLGAVGMQEFRAALQTKLDASCAALLTSDCTSDENAAGLALLGHQVITSAKTICKPVYGHVVTKAEPDSMEPFWCMEPHERLHAMREARQRALEGDEDSAQQMGEAAMSLMLDVDTRMSLDDADYQETAIAWAASLPSGRDLLRDTRMDIPQPSW